MPAPRKKPSLTPPKTTAKPGPATNLELQGDRLKVFSLQRLLTNKRNPETRAVAKLGDVLLPWFEKTISKPAEKLDGISELWQKHVPQNILTRCRIISYLRGVLTVGLDSAPVRAELDAQLRGGLLKILQSESRGTLYRIKTCVTSPAK